MICVDDGPNSFTGDPSGLTKWKEYDVFPCKFPHHTQRLGVVIPGLSIPGPYRCWSEKRFRPIREVDVTTIFKCEELIGEGV